MSRRRRTKITPEEQARRQAEKAERFAEVERLRATGADVRADGQGNIVHAQRLDVFEMLHRKGALGQGSYDAIRSLERDLHLAAGCETPERSIERVQRSVEGAPGQNVTRAMIDASFRVEVYRANLSPRDFGLLSALLEPSAAILTRWRDVVSRFTGENRNECQASTVRHAAANLVWISNNMDRLLRERAALRRAAA